ncbi:MAG TPA: diacylglycerol kinase family protein [Acidimicrobiales bacterium]|jgi:diacylglycerol kinase family enzyme|nr:diacylglycerol kinase family protein [Acidimicrobiales bacterium]
MRLLLIVNASASSVTARARVVIQKALAADHDLAVAETSRRGHASRLAQGAAADNVEAVLVLGGDGTLNEAANGLAGTSTALGVLPGGSTNVFARSIGMTNDPIEATGELLGALARGSIRPVNLGSVNGRYFLFHVGIGFDAAVVSRVERRATLKRYAGHPLFVWAAVATWSRHYDRRRPHFRLEVPGREAVEDGFFAIGLNCDPYTFLRDRPLHVAPGTGLDTALALVTFRTLDLAIFVPLIVDALFGGRRLGRHRRVDRATQVTEAVVTGYGPVPYQVDGDYLGEAERLDLRSESAVLRLVVP